MLLFPDKNEKQREREANPATDRKARAIASAIVKRQKKAARWLGRKFGALPHHTQMIGLLLFCLVLGGASGWILAEAVLPGPKPAAIPGLQHIVPDETKDPVASTPGVSPRLTQRQHQQKLQSLPDSLGHTDKKHLSPLK